MFTFPFKICCYCVENALVDYVCYVASTANTIIRKEMSFSFNDGLRASNPYLFYLFYLSCIHLLYNGNQETINLKWGCI